VGIEEGKEVQAKGRENIFDKIVEIFPSLEKKSLSGIVGFKTPNRQNQKEPL
jgi:hypothetical protein